MTLYGYDSHGNLTSKQVGLLDSGSGDVQQAEYGVWNYQYDAQGLLLKEMDPLYHGSHTDLHVTDYEYHPTLLRRTRKIEAAATAGGPRPTTVYAYDDYGRLISITDPAGKVTDFTYDGLNRVVETLYPDGSSEQFVYGTAGSGRDLLVVKSKDRHDVVSTYTYDAAGRLSEKLAGTARQQHPRRPARRSAPYRSESAASQHLPVSGGHASGQTPIQRRGKDRV